MIFSASGQAAPTATTDLAIGKISIGGSVERTQILAGYDVDLNPVNGNAQIGSVSVGSDWIASDLIAGMQDGGTAGFGDAGDTIIGGIGSAKIARIIVGGIVEGTPGTGDQFGIESHAIGSFKVNGSAILVPVAPGSIALSPLTADVTLRTI